MQRVIKIGTGKKYNLGLHFGNQRKGILEKIHPGDVKITGVYDEELQELKDNEEEEEEDEYVDNVYINQTTLEQ